MFTQKKRQKHKTNYLKNCKMETRTTTKPINKIKCSKQLSNLVYGKN